MSPSSQMAESTPQPHNHPQTPTQSDNSAQRKGKRGRSIYQQFSRKPLNPPKNGTPYSLGHHSAPSLPNETPASVDGQNVSIKTKRLMPTHHEVILNGDSVGGSTEPTNAQHAPVLARRAGHNKTEDVPFEAVASSHGTGPPEYGTGRASPVVNFHVVRDTFNQKLSNTVDPAVPKATIEIIDLTSEPDQSPRRSPESGRMLSPVGAAMNGAEKENQASIVQDDRQSSHSALLGPSPVTVTSSPDDLPPVLPAGPSTPSALLVPSLPAPPASLLQNGHTRQAKPISWDQIQKLLPRWLFVVGDLETTDRDFMMINQRRRERPRRVPLSSSNSDAIDAIIYQNSGSRPPAGVRLASRNRKEITVKESGRAYVHTNPAVHRMHHRSAARPEQKVKEAEARGGQKAWHRRAGARERWRRAKEEAEVGNLPRPWSHQRPADFGEVPEEELSKDVQENLPWAKACAWHRQTPEVAVMRRRKLDQSKEETWKHFSDLVNQSK